MDRSRHSRCFRMSCTSRHRSRQTPQHKSRLPSRSMCTSMCSSVSSTLVTVWAFRRNCFLIKVSMSTSFGPFVVLGQETTKVNRCGVLLKPRQSTTSSIQRASTAITLLGQEPFFADALHGWIMLRATSSSNFSLGMLFATLDGGITWSKLPDPPIGEAVYFSSPTDGWLAGGPNGDALFVTRNAGQSWTRQQLPLPPSIDQPAGLSYTLPRFADSAQGFIRAAISYPEKEVVVLYQSHDRGATWELLRSYDSDPDTQGWLLRRSALVADTLIMLPRSRPTVLLITRSGVRLRSTNVLGDTPKGEITRVDFVDENTGWLLFTDGQCADLKTGCSQRSSMVVTRDGAQFFVDVAPLEESQPEPSAPPPLAEEVPTLPPGNLRETDGTSSHAFSSGGAAAAIVSQQLGFDKCAADTVAHMQTWFASSPYYDTGIYIGGSNRSCSQPNLTASWLSQLGTTWRFMPLWVGPQAPCTSCPTCGTMSATAATAASQGTAEADSAANAAAALGLASPTIVYYDMEQYNATASCSAAVSAFVNAWVQRMKQRGNLAGV